MPDTKVWVEISCVSSDEGEDDGGASVPLPVARGSGSASAGDGSAVKLSMRSKEQEREAGLARSSGVLTAPRSASVGKGQQGDGDVDAEQRARGDGNDPQLLQQDTQLDSNAAREAEDVSMDVDQPEQLNVPAQLPQPGDLFDSDDAFFHACSRGLQKSFGFKMWRQVRTASVLRSACSRRRVCDDSCRFAIEVKRQGERWEVDGDASCWEHTHGPRDVVDSKEDRATPAEKETKDDEEESGQDGEVSDRSAAEGQVPDATTVEEGEDAEVASDDDSYDSDNTPLSLTLVSAVTPGLIALNAFAVGKETLLAQQRARGTASLQAESARCVDKHVNSYSKAATIKSLRYRFGLYSDFCAMEAIPVFPIVGDIAALWIHQMLASKKSSYQFNGSLCNLDRFRRVTAGISKGRWGCEEVENSLLSHHAIVAIYRERLGKLALSTGENESPRRRAIPLSSSALTSSASLSSSDHLPPVPRAGDRFDTFDAFRDACSLSGLARLGINMTRWSTSRTSWVMVCNRGTHLGKDSTELCKFRIVAVLLLQTDAADTLCVSDDRSHWEHNHGPDLRIVADPNWRPRAVGPAGAALIAQSRALLDAGALEGRRNAAPSGASLSTAFSHVVDASASKTVPKIGDRFPSQDAFRLAVPRAFYSLGSPITVLQSPKAQSNYCCQVGCPRGGSERCRARVTARCETPGDPSGTCVVTAVALSHNHDVRSDRLGPWKAPMAFATRRSIATADDDSDSEEAEESDDGEPDGESWHGMESEPEEARHGDFTAGGVRRESSSHKGKHVVRNPAPIKRRATANKGAPAAKNRKTAPDAGITSSSTSRLQASTKPASASSASGRIAMQSINIRSTSSPQPSAISGTNTIPSLDADPLLQPLSVNDVKAFLTSLSPILTSHGGAIHAYGVQSLGDAVALLQLSGLALVRVVDELEEDGLPRFSGRVLLKALLGYQESTGM